jgi:Ricin-type beta-trefoil lectin domain
MTALEWKASRSAPGVSAMSFDPEFDGEPYKKHGQRQRRPVVMLLAFLMAILLAFAILSVRVAQTVPTAIAVMPLPSPVMVAPPVPRPPGPLIYHLIVNRETGQCLDVPRGNSEPRTRVEQFTINGDGNQLWNLEPMAGGAVRIVNKHSGKCLDIADQTQELHVAVEQSAEGSNQGWQLEPVGDGWYRIVSERTGMCLEVPCESQERRTAIEQAKPRESTYQQWRLIAVR